MKISKFPQLVQHQLLRIMDPPELFLLSLLSKKTRNTIKFLKPRKVSDVVVEVGREIGQAEFKLREGNEYSDVMTLNEEMDSEDTRKKLEMLISRSFYIGVRLTNGIHVYTDEHNSVLKIHKYLSDLFNAISAGLLRLPSGLCNYTSFRSESNLEVLMEKMKTEEIEQRGLNKTRNNFRRWRNSDQRNPEELKRPLQYLTMDVSLGASIIKKGFYENPCLKPFTEKFFKTFPDLTFCIIEQPLRYNSTLTRDMKIFKLQDLIVRNGEDSDIMFICNFQGHNILMENCWFLTAPAAMLEKLVNSWKNGDRENLVSFIAYQDPKNLVDPTPYLDVFGNEKWDPEKRGRYYPYESIISDHHTWEPDTFDCADGVEIIRTTDGKRATVKITPQNFMFFVWP